MERGLRPILLLLTNPSLASKVIEGAEGKGEDRNSTTLPLGVTVTLWGTAKKTTVGTHTHTTTTLKMLAPTSDKRTQTAAKKKGSC